MKFVQLTHYILNQVFAALGGALLNAAVGQLHIWFLIGAVAMDAVTIDETRDVGTGSDPEAELFVRAEELEGFWGLNRVAKAEKF